MLGLYPFSGTPKGMLGAYLFSRTPNGFAVWKGHTSFFFKSAHQITYTCIKIVRY